MMKLQFDGGKGGRSAYGVLRIKMRLFGKYGRDKNQPPDIAKRLKRALSGVLACMKTARFGKGISLVKSPERHPATIGIPWDF